MTVLRQDIQRNIEVTVMNLNYQLLSEILNMFVCNINQHNFVLASAIFFLPLFTFNCVLVGLFVS